MGKSNDKPSQLDEFCLLRQVAAFHLQLFAGAFTRSNTSIFVTLRISIKEAREKVDMIEVCNQQTFTAYNKEVDKVSKREIFCKIIFNNFENRGKGNTF